MFKVPHQVYTAEFKEAAVQRIKDGQGVSARAAARRRFIPSGSVIRFECSARAHNTHHDPFCKLPAVFSKTCPSRQTNS